MLIFDFHWYLLLALWLHCSLKDPFSHFTIGDKDKDEDYDDKKMTDFVVVIQVKMLVIIMTSCQSNLTKGCIAVTWTVQLYCQVVPMLTPSDTCFLSPSESIPHTTSPWFICFSRSHDHERQTDWPTDHTTGPLSVTIGSIYIHSIAMRPNNMQCLVYSMFVVNR